MKWSKYNYWLESDKYGSFIYNAVTNSFIKVQSDLKAQVHNVLDWKKQFRDFPEEFQDILLKHKIVVEDQDDEDYYVKRKYAKFLSCFSNRAMNLTIATTTGCNFACPYCYEKGALVQTMNRETEKGIVDFVRNAGVKRLNVTWYGGEPLMNFESIVRLSEDFHNIPNVEGITYGIITNGYFLDKEKALVLKKYNIKSIQITIDGLAETHNKLRVAKDGQPTFERIVKNIDEVVDLLPDCLFKVRVNINKQNGEEYALLYKEFRNKWKEKKNFAIYFSFVEDYGQCDVDCYTSKEKIDFIRELRERYGISTRNFYPRRTLGLCMAGSVNGFVIAPEGELYKCWSDIGKKDKIVGSVFDRKMVNYELLAHYAIDMDKFEDSKCKTCFLFPVCSGSCPAHRYNNLYKNQKHEICPYESVNIDSVLEMIYEDYLMTKNQNV
ncbi:MAG: radical SAM protein [Odoribacter splanchnicus]